MHARAAWFAVCLRACFTVKEHWILWLLWSAWFRTCLPLVSQYTLDSLPTWFQACLLLVSTCLPLVLQHTLDALSSLPLVSGYTRHWILPLVSTCLHLSPSALDALSALVRMDGLSAVVRMTSLVSHTCVRLLVSNLSSSSLWMVTVLRFAWFYTCFPPVYTCLPLLPTPWVVLHCLRVCGTTTTTNHLQQPPPSTFAGSDLNWSTNKLFGVNVGIVFSNDSNDHCFHCFHSSALKFEILPANDCSDCRPVPFGPWGEARMTLRLSRLKSQSECSPQIRRNAEFRNKKFHQNPEYFGKPVFVRSAFLHLCFLRSSVSAGPPWSTRTFEAN